MDYINNHEKLKGILSYIQLNLSEKRKVHTEGVRTTAVKLSNLYGESAEKAELAALFHDMFRGLSIETMNSYVKKLGLDEKYRNNPNLAHGKIAAAMMIREFQIEDSDIINAVSYHTTGRERMSVLEKIIYIADTIEPARTYPGVEEVRKLAFEDLDKACYVALSNTINYVTKRGESLDRDTLLAKEYLEKELKKKKGETE